MRALLALVGVDNSVVAYVSVRLPHGLVPTWVDYDGASYRYTSERTAGGWRVYQRRG